MIKYFILGTLVVLNFVALYQILNIVTMSQETLAQLKALAQRANAALDTQTTALTNIAGDITRIKDGLPTTGGLTEAEVADLKADMEGVATKAETAASAADALDKENEPEAPGGPGTGG